MTQFKRLRAITLPQLKIVDERPYYLKFCKPMFQGKEIKNSTMGPATLAEVTDLETGELCHVIVNSVLAKILTEETGEYVGKCFEIVAHGPRANKRYKTFSVAEIAEPDPEELAATWATAKANAVAAAEAPPPIAYGVDPLAPAEGETVNTNRSRRRAA